MAIFTAHDRLFHTTFRNPRLVACWLCHVLPGDVRDALDLDSLALANDRVVGLGLRTHAADLVFTVRLASSDELALLILEHKAHRDPHWQSQLLRYSVHLRRLARRRGEAEPFVVPILLYHGELPLADEPAASHPALARLQPRQDCVVSCLAAHDEEALCGEGLPARLRLTLLALARLRHLDRTAALAAVDRWGPLLQRLEDEEAPPDALDAIDAFGWYVLEATDVSPEELHVAIQKHLTSTMSSTMTTAQRLRREGHEAGLSQGISQGISQGLSQGQRLALERQLQRRFGPLAPHVTERLANASPDDLGRWLDRILDAGTLDDVFA